MRGKNRATAIIIATILAVCLTAFAGAIDYSVSPGLIILKNKLEMKKCGVINCDISFDRDEFSSLLGDEYDIDYITITHLPDCANGVLRISGHELLEGQSIAYKNLDLLRYVPTLNTTSCDSFSFSVNGAGSESSIVCTLNILDKINLAPTTSRQSVSTLKNVELIKSFKVADPDNDSMLFEIVDLPKNGTLVMENAYDGRFMYSPDKDYVGSDSFSYTASDIYGNKSDVTYVNIKVQKRSSDTDFADMSGHWAKNSALKMHDLGLMKGQQNNFYPDNTITRGDFLALAMIMTGNEDKVTLDEVSVFADDSGIPANIRCYAVAAYTMGVVSGYESDGKRYFNWEDTITRAEAAVILDRLIKAPSPAINPEFVDALSIPSWADSSIMGLVSCGIMNGVGGGAICPEKALTRGEAAELLCNVSDYLEEKQREEKKQKSKGFLSFLPFFK